MPHGVWCLVIESCLTLCDPMDCGRPGSSVHEESPGKNTGVGCHVLLQGIFPTQGSQHRQKIKTKTQRQSLTDVEVRNPKHVSWG